MKVAHLSNNDIGGAGIAAERLHRALLRQNIDSVFISKQKHNSKIPRHVQFNPIGHLMNRMGTKLGVTDDPLKELTQRHLANRPKGFEHFSFPFSNLDLTNHKQVKDSDIIHLHWVSDGFLDFSSFFNNVDKPVVWTLHDMNPFTGGCHHADDCLGYQSNCIGCPQLKNTIDENYSAEILKLKIESLKNSVSENLKIITPSKWLMKCSMQSKVFGGLTHFNIPNIPDVKSFFPMDKSAARNNLGLPTDKKILLFVAKDIDNPRKGIQFLQKAIEGMGEDVLICSVGKAEAVFPDSFNFEYVVNNVMLNEIYNAADVFVLPSLAENFPNTICEAILCGTPVAAFDIGGVPELINEKNGILAEYKNEDSLRQAIEGIVNNPASYIKEIIAAEAKERFDVDKIINAHIQVYESFKLN